VKDRPLLFPDAQISQSVGLFPRGLFRLYPYIAIHQLTISIHKPIHEIGADNGLRLMTCRGGTSQQALINTAFFLTVV
jgi:hypothetical protein